MVPKRRLLKCVVACIFCAVLFLYFPAIHTAFEVSDGKEPSVLPKEPPVSRDTIIARVTDVVTLRQNTRNGLTPSSVSQKKTVPKRDNDLRDSETEFTSKDCTGSTFRLRLPSDLGDDWRTAFYKPKPFHVYSAYVDRKSVKILAIAERAIGAFCQFWYGGNNPEMRSSSVAMSIIPETHGFRYVPIIVSCGLPADVKTMPAAVSLGVNRCDHPQALLGLHSRPDNWKATYNFTLCPAPFNREYNKLGEFLQYIEVNGLFGADHFIFHNHSVSNELRPYIDYYIEKGKIQVLPWNIPVTVKQGPTNEIHYFGQVIAQSECFLRAMMNSRYVISLDMDEVIVPMKTPDWQSAIGDHPEIAAFLFPNIFFRKEWDPNPKFEKHELMLKYPIDSLLYTKREPKVWYHGSRSKYIARPEGVSMAGIHSPFGLHSGFRSMNIPSDVGFLAHFRNWEDYRAAPQTEELRLHDFSDEILQRVSKVVNEVKTRT